MSDLPGFVWLLVLVGVIAMPLTTSTMLRRSVIAAGLGRDTGVRFMVVAALAWCGWIVVNAVLARGGLYRQDAAALNPWIRVALLGSMAAALAAARIPVISRTLAAPGTLARLAVPQTLRVVGATFLIVMALGDLPAVFAIPAGLGDVAVGLAAPWVAWRLAHGEGRRGAVWFNVLGIADLVIAVGIGFLAGLGPSRLLQVTPSTAAVSVLPFVLIPTTAVPLALALHVISLRGLAAQRNA